MMRVPRVLLAAALLSSLIGCRREPPRVVAPIPAPPAPVDPFEGASRLFAERRFAEAAGAYQDALAAHPGAPDRDPAMVRLALALALADKPESAAETLRRLIAASPRGSWRPLADRLLELGSEVRRLEVANADLENLLAFYRTQLDGARAPSAAAPPKPDRLRHEVARRDERIRRLNAEIDALEERIRRLSAELENLRKIDLDRRRPR